MKNKLIAIVVIGTIILSILTSCTTRGERIVDIALSATDTAIAIKERNPLKAIDSGIETVEKTVDSIKKTKEERK